MAPHGARASDAQKLVRVRAFSHLISKLMGKATMVVIGDNTYHWRSGVLGFTTALFNGEVYTVWGSSAQPRCELSVAPGLVGAGSGVVGNLCAVLHLRLQLPQPL